MLNRIKITTLILIFLLIGCGQKNDFDVEKTNKTSSALTESIKREYGEYSEKLFDLTEKLAINSINLSDIGSSLNKKIGSMQPDERMPLLEISWILNTMANETVAISGLTLAIARGGLLLDLITEKSYTFNHDLMTRAFFFSPQVNPLIFMIENENEKIKSFIREISINGITQEMNAAIETMEEINSVLKNMHNESDLVNHEQLLEIEDTMRDIIEDSKRN
ncbi:MAG: hypothetical protein P9L96_01430 [Candidatus Gygaella obscura]|nr:hypothetical protein [Candidatus Gygaella obscura]